MDPNQKNNENLSQKLNKLKNKIIMAKAAIIVFIKLLPILLLGTVVAGIVATVVSFFVNVTTSENTAKATYEVLQIEDMAELVAIKQNSSGEYYLDFIDGIDDKLEEIVEHMNSTSGVHNLPSDIEFLKEIIKAEVITKFPNLGGQVPEGTTGFQGAVDLRRITPNKAIGDITNTGKGETSNIEQEQGYEPDANVAEYERLVKSWSQGQELYLNQDAVVYKQAESKLNPGSDTGYWEEVYVEGKLDTKLKIKKGTKVTYTGTYKNNTNSLTKVTTTYVEVKTDEVTGFVKAQYLYQKGSSESEIVSKVQNSQNRFDTQVTSRSPAKTIGISSKEYVIAISAGHNNTDNTGARNGDLREEELTIKVAEKVEKLFEGYSNVKIVQTGSTSSNPGGVKKEERTTLTRNANPDMAVVIHFNSSASGNATGVEAIYKEGDGISQQFAEILSKNIAKSMGLTDRGAGTDIEKSGKSLLTIENAATTGFPTVLTEGGFLNGAPDEDIIRADGIDKYAQGIFNSIKEYIEVDKEGYTSTNIQDQKAQYSIESKVTKMKYVPKETFESLVESNNADALKLFSIDEDDGFKILTATWSYNNGNIEISQNTSIDFRTSLEKYTMPYEYLLFYYTDTDYKDFSLELAQKVVEETEIVIALQDNISTTKEVDTTYQNKVISLADYQEEYGYDWKEVTKEENLTESCSTSIDITYVNTWCVKAYNESSYSEQILNMGDQDEIIINLKGTSTETTSESETAEAEIETGTIDIDGSDEFKKDDKVICEIKSYHYGWDSNSNSYKRIDDKPKNEDGDGEEYFATGTVLTYVEDMGQDKICKVKYEGNIYYVKNVNLIKQNLSCEYSINEKVKTQTHNISTQYETGEAKTEGKENIFVELYQKHKMPSKIREDWLFKILENNEKTVDMVDLTKYLMFKATSENYGVIEYDFGEFDLSLFNNIASSSGGISLTTSMFTKETFIKAMTEYGAKSGNANFNTNFLPYAEEIYDVSVASGVNPELVVVTAKTEQNFKAGGGNYNYWGIGVTNGSQSGGSYSSLADGIRAYADTLKNYQPGGKFAASITQKYEERKASGCDPLGYGLPGTLSGMQSIYSHLGKHEEGSSGAGGYYYMDPDRAGVTKIYATHQEFLDKCLNAGGEHAAGTVTTPWEQGQYTAWQLEEKIKVWNEIFGAYGSLSSDGEFLGVAQEVWNKVCQEFTTYGGTSIPPKGKTIDCSSYVSWVLYEYGYTEFEGGQHNTSDFLNTNFNKKYSWEEISVGSGQNPVDQLRPGDIFVRVGGGTHHMLIVKEIKNGRLLAYDCGDESNWLGKNGNPADVTYFLTATGNGKIIRVTHLQ